MESCAIRPCPPLKLLLPPPFLGLIHSYSIPLEFGRTDTQIRNSGWIS